ncbi:MAG: energy transducer TonB [Terracidiphilus sp.]|jgi:protein TonB
MFEDSTFESAGRIRTRSRRWMIAAFTFNTTILLALILIPLICPQALPHHGINILITAPAPQPPETPPPTAQTAPAPTHMYDDPFAAPRKIPPYIYVAARAEPPIVTGPEGMGPNPTANGDDPFGRRPAVTVVRPEVTTLRVSTAVEAGLLIRKTMPVYPLIAKEARVSGTVALEATISKTGTIENLRVTSGPAMLQRAALDAVSTWQYRPYLLDGRPVEVETTVNVIFTLER